jgi:hypothetical protein
VALTDDVPELVGELRKRTARAQHLEAQIIAVKKTPAELTKLVKQIETTSRVKLADLRAALADESDRREMFLALFPEGLTFTTARTPDGKRQIWQISGDIDLGSLTDGAGSRIVTIPRPANDENQVVASTAKLAKSGAGSEVIVTPKGLEPLFSA